MKLNLAKTWLSSYNFIKEHPVVLTPFIVIAFLECSILEVAYFCARKPLLFVFGPIVRKFFGEQFLHYPANLMLMPKLFSFGQMVVYVLGSVFLTAAAIQIFLNINSGHPVIFKAIIKNTAKKYMALVGYGLIYIIILLILQRLEGTAFLKAARFISKRLFGVPNELFAIASSLLLFLVAVFTQVFLVLVIPIIVMDRKRLITAVVESISLGLGNFLKLFGLILLPLFFYVPVLLMKDFLAIVMDKTFPEISLLIMLLNIVMAIFIDCFIAIFAAQFLLDTKKAK
ncbi:MAG: hypothetical protein Q8O01_00980 [Candidatus Omnitrophota bacterium]|nr:hypothetical protein [Candidatus Omnitrophota bacterium]